MHHARRLIFVLLTGTIIVMFVSVGLAVGSRYILGRPLFWTEELARFALVWMTFLGSAALLERVDGHIRFDFLQSRLGARANALFGMVCSLIIMGTLSIILVGSVLMIQTSGKHISPALSIPMPYVYAVIPLCAVIGIVATLRNFAQQFKQLRAAP